MKSIIDVRTESDVTLDQLLDEINRQRKTNSELQTELRTTRIRESRLLKTIEVVKAENRRLQDEITIFDQKIRELDIQLTLPESERSFISSRDLKPIARKSTLRKRLNWKYFVAPCAIIAGIITFKSIQQNTDTLPATALTTAVAVPQSIASTQNMPTAAPIAAFQDGYLVVNNPLVSDDPVRVRDGFGSQAREVAFVDPGTKFRIREQSPRKMKRAILLEGKTITVEDYFYKISDKDQWIFGFFTNRRTYNL